MKTQPDQRKSSRTIKITTECPTIPKCSSAQVFFTHKILQKRKNQKFHTEAKNLFLSIKKLTFSDKIHNSIQPKSFSVAPTMETSLHQGHLQFRKKQPKRKLNINVSKRQQRNMGQYSKLTSHRQICQRNKFKSIIRRISLDDFVILKKIGEGSYSRAYLVLQKHIGFICVLKVIQKQSIKKNQLQNVLTRELKIHQFLNNDNIIALYGFFHDQQRIYLISEYANDGDLFKKIKKIRKNHDLFSIREIASTIKQLCKAVYYLHSNSLMHRDIKPQNIFLSFGSIKLGDFGWSVYNVHKKLRQTRCGTPLYLAPQLIGEGEYSEAVDIWAIGILAYEMLTGELPFSIKAPNDLKKVIQQDIDFSTIENERARDFVSCLLEKDMNKRIEIDDVLLHPFLQFQELY